MIVFSESVHESKYIKHQCDDQFSIKKYDKGKTMNQMRELLFFESQADYTTNKGKLSQLFSDEKHKMKTKNRQLHNLFRKENVMLHSILEQHKVVEFIQVPSCAKIKITNGRFVWANGNGICFIGESDNAYYVADWRGS